MSGSFSTRTRGLMRRELLTTGAGLAETTPLVAAADIPPAPSHGKETFLDGKILDPERPLR